MITYEHCRVEIADNIAIVRIDRPEARNAFTVQTVQELTAIATDLRRDPHVRAVILTGGERGFSAGQDLSVRPATDTPETLIEKRSRMQSGSDLARAWEEIEAVTIAAIDGYCIGGGCALALACDFRILGTDAYFRLPEIPLGMNMPWRTLPRLAVLVGPARAKRMAMFGEKIDAETALSWGLADEVCGSGEAITVAERWAARVAALPPLPVRMTKEAVNAASNALNAAVAYVDRDQYLLTSLSDDLQEGIAAFREKRSPRFTGN